MLILGIYLLIMGSIWTIDILYQSWLKNKLKRNGTKTSGVCVELRYYDEELLSAFLVVDFSAEDGKKYTIVSKTGSAFNEKYLNKAITVYYDKNNPAKALIKNEVSIAIIISFIFYLSIFLIGVLLVLAQII